MVKEHPEDKEASLSHLQKAFESQISMLNERLAHQKVILDAFSFIPM